MKNNWKWMFVLLWALLGCSDTKDTAAGGNTKVQEHTIAVVMPLGGGLEEHWRRTLAFLNRNMEIAFQGRDTRVSLKYELFDEDKEDAGRLAESLARRDDIEAVVGCLYSANAQAMIGRLADAGKPLFTMSTSAELARTNTRHGYLWAMVETDITQCEVLLSKAQGYGAKKVSLLAREDNPYCNTFVDWFPFQAGELGLEVSGVHLYNENNVGSVCEAACATGTDYIVCVPATVEEVGLLCDAFARYEATHTTAPRRIFGDTAFGSDVLEQYGDRMEGLEGITFTADPESGFEVSYRTFFNEEPSLGESQLYDACTLLYYAWWHGILHEAEGPDLTACLRAVVDGRDMNHFGWMAEDMRMVVSAMSDGQRPDINGASGNLDFDKNVYTSVLETTYANFMVYGGRYVTLGYNKSNGGRRSDATLAGWNWKSTQMQEFGEADNISYPALRDKWALLVAGSVGWENYRHQADVLSVYRMLREKGYPDDHIILIMEDDIAYHADNPCPGEIRTDMDDDNLYTGVKADYRVSELSPADVMNILSGVRTDRTPAVIGSGRQDNVLVFWSGHGTQAELCWGREFMGVRKEMVSATLESMAREGRFRKLLFLVEACYSGSIAKEVKTPGVLFVTAANDKETSKAENYSNRLGVWMTNRFTYGLREQLEDDVHVSLRDLYYRLFINTIGSHVTIYNTPNFGNIHTNDISEFFLFN